MFHYDRFDKDAKRIITTAMNEARHRKHERYTIEHLLLGFTSPESPVARVLHEHGLSHANISSRMEQRHPQHTTAPGGHTPAAPYVIEIYEDAYKELKKSGLESINCTHLLYNTIKILNQYDSVAAKICSDLHVDCNALFRDVAAMVDREAQARHDQRKRELEHAIAFNLVPAEALVAAVLDTVDEDQLIQILDQIKAKK